MLGAISCLNSSIIGKANARRDLSSKVTLMSYSLSDYGNLYISWYIMPSFPVYVSWTNGAYNTVTTSFRIVPSGTTSVTIPGFVAATDGTSVTYVITLTQMKEDEVTLTRYTQTFPITATSSVTFLLPAQTVARSLAMSSSGQTIVLGNENGFYISTDYGSSFTSNSFKTFTTTNYITLVSNDGKYVIAYNPVNNTTCTYYYSSNSGVTFETRQISSTLTFQLISFAASSDFQYVFASGSGTNGGVFVCKTDFGRTFTRVLASTTFQGVGCSPNGRTVVVANNGATPYYSTNYGTSFTTITSETITYAGRRVFVHPDETSFMIRCVSPDAVYCTNVLKPDYTFIDTEYRLATTQPIINSLPGDNESVAHLDRNGKFFFITSNYLSWIPSSFQGANGSQNSITEIGVLTDTRFRASMDSKYFLVFSDSKLRLYTAWKESNRATVTSSSIDASSQLTVNWTLQTPNRPVSITWTPKSVLFSQPFIVTDPSATSATIPGFVNIAPSSTVQITVTPLTENGLYNSLMTSPSSSFEVEPFKGSNAYNISDPILPTAQSTCRCIGMSRNGRYVLWGNDNGIFVSSDFGQTMSLKYSSTITPLFTDPNTSLLYSALLSDDGIYIVIYLSSSNSSSCWVSSDGGITFSAKSFGATILLANMAMSASGKYVYLCGSNTGGGLRYSTDFGSTYIYADKFRTIYGQGCQCSADGKIVVATATDRSAVSTDYGLTFSFFNDFYGTGYSAARAFMHPTLPYFLVRCTSASAYVYSTPTYPTALSGRLTYTQPNFMSLTPGNVDFGGAIDQIGRFYFLSADGLLFFTKHDSFNSIDRIWLGSLQFTNRALCASQDGKYLIGVINDKLKVITLHNETNTVTATTTPTFDSKNTVTLSWSLSLNPRRVQITWTPFTNNTQPVFSQPGDTSIQIPGFVASTTYTFTIASLTNDSANPLVTGSTTMSPVMSNINSVETLVTGITSINTIGISASGQYVLCMDSQGRHWSEDYGKTFTLKSTAKVATVTILISDTGLYSFIFNKDMASVYISNNVAMSYTLTKVETVYLKSIAATPYLQTAYATAQQFSGNLLGGIYRTTNFGTTWTRVAIGETYSGIACSRDGRTVVAVANSGIPQISYDYGVTFVNILSTSISSIKPNVHPDGYYFNLQSDNAERRYIATSTAQSSSLISTSTYIERDSSSNSLVGNLPKQDGFSYLDINGRYYFVIGDKLYWIPLNADAYTMIAENMSFTDKRINLSPDGKYVYYFNSTSQAIQRMQLFSGTDQINNIQYTMTQTGVVTFTWTTNNSTRAILIEWRTCNTIDNTKIYNAGSVLVNPGTTTTQISGFVYSSASPVYLFTFNMRDESNNFTTTRKTCIVFTRDPSANAIGTNTSLFPLDGRAVTGLAVYTSSPRTTYTLSGLLPSIRNGSYSFYTNSQLQASTHPVYAFATQTTDTNQYQCTNTPYLVALPNGDFGTGNTPAYIYVKLPFACKLQSFSTITLSGTANINRMMQCQVHGSNNQTDWFLLKSFDDVSSITYPTYNAEITYNVNCPVNFNSYRFEVITTRGITGVTGGTASGNCTIKFSNFVVI